MTNLSKVYLEAARKVADHEEHFSCSASHRSGGKVDAYRSLFKPESTMWLAWWNEGWDGPCNTAQDLNERNEFLRNCRTLALCFMAAIVEAGDAS